MRQYLSRHIFNPVALLSAAVDFRHNYRNLIHRAKGENSKCKADQP